MQKIAAVLLSLSLMTSPVHAEPKVKCQQGVVMEIWLMTMSATALYYLYKYVVTKEKLEELKAKTAPTDCKI
jgi:hypothetical protein